MSEPIPSPASQNWRLETWFPHINKEIIAKLKVYFEDLIVANRAISLVSPKTIPFADAIHFADSILAIEALLADSPGVQEIYDLGSGNGFPGLVGAILFPKVKFILVDTDEKKNEYLRQCATKLGLPNVEVKTAAIEALPVNSVQFAITRGLANISKTILLTRKCFVKGGVLYHMKSENWAMEVGEIPTQLCSVWSPALVKEYKLPVGEMRFAIVKTEKIS